MWDIMMLLPLLFLIATVPLRIGFELDEDDGRWFVLERIVDAFFIVDILTNFRTSYVDDHGNEILTPSAIAKRCTAREKKVITI